MKVLFAPDYRAGNPYQRLLADALARTGVDVVFADGYHRGLPLARLVRRHAPDLVHLHWPEAYFPRRFDAVDGLREWRFPIDLRLASFSPKLIYTAHNHLPHDRPHATAIVSNYRTVLSRASAVIAHSQEAARQIVEFCPTAAGKIFSIPHGDLADAFPILPTRLDARRQLGFTADERVVLMFGRVKPYKGLLEIIEAWNSLHASARLLICGNADDDAFRAQLAAAAGACARVSLELTHLPEEALAIRIAAADVILFNYGRILTSGAACLSRSLGKPIVLPARLTTVDLMEPAATVFRFNSISDDLHRALAEAIEAGPDTAGTHAWREATSWNRVAAETKNLYDRALSDNLRGFASRY